MQALRPSLLLAVAFERAQGSQKALIEGLWRRGPSEPARPDQVQSIYSQLKVEERTRVLLETYKEQAVRSLHELDNANLKGLLRRVIGRIFNDAEIKGWCREFQAKNAARAAADSGPASDSVAMGAA
jgi:hypothetical protein